MTEHNDRANAEDVLACIARTVLTPTDSHEHSTVGDITLQTHQQDAVIRLAVAIRNHHGALLADSVGLGKTYVALALAKHFASAHILAPASLLPMWRSAIGHTQSNNTSLHSLHALSRTPLNLESNRSSSLVIIDEAHHLRTSNTTRYRNAAHCVSGRNVLLVSATPLHNKPRELQHLLALFLGNTSRTLSADALAQLVVRRTSVDVNAPSIPGTKQHAHNVPHNPEVLNAILTLPPPLPLQHGVAASALIRLGLLRAWCSSDAALTSTIRKRELRGEALLHALQHGRHPGAHELSAWIVGHNSIQLAFPELVFEATSTNTAQLIPVVLQHLDALRVLLQLHVRTSTADPHRAALLRSLLKRTPHPIIAFSQFAETVKALHRALSDIAGVASLTSQHARIASGTLPRQELIERFSPNSNGRPPPPPHQAVKLLLTTDLLSEGVNLQDASTLVHLDLPWTNAIQIQRVGRLARLGSPHQAIHVHTFAPPPGTDAALRLVATLEAKATLTRRYVGGETPVHNGLPPSTLSANCSATTTPQLSGAELATAIRNVLKPWLGKRQAFKQPSHHASTTSGRCQGSGEARDHHLQNRAGECATHSSLAIATVRAGLAGVIAVTERNGISEVIAAHWDAPESDSNYALNYSTELLLSLLASLELPLAVQPHDVKELEQVFAQVERWNQNRASLELTGPAPSNIPNINARALRLLAARVAHASAVSRLALEHIIAKVEFCVRHARGAGAELSLAEWCAMGRSVDVEKWLRALDQFPSLSVARDTVPAASEARAFRLHAILILRHSARL